MMKILLIGVKPMWNYVKQIIISNSENFHMETLIYENDMWMLFWDALYDFT